MKSVCLGILFLTCLESVSAASGSSATIIGQCTFYGDQRVDCRGRLRCKPSDFSQSSVTSGLNDEDQPEQQPQEQEQQQLPDLEVVCPGVDEAANGTWKLSQGIVPADYANIPYPAEIVAKCHFRTNGSFSCIGGPVWSDTFWEGLYSGSLNSAFELGLDRWFFTQVATRPTTTTTTTTTTVSRRRPTDRLQRWPAAVPRVDDDYERNDYRGRQNRPGNAVAESNDNRDYDSVPSRQQRPDSNTEDEEPDDDLNRVSGTRDAVNRYDAIRDAQRNNNNNNNNNNDDDQSSVSYTIAPQRVFVCEYYKNGQVGCRNCTERVIRIVLETGENGNRRDYNCSQPKGGPILKRWNDNNGIIPMSPDPTAPRQVVATCIFEKTAQTYECHGESSFCPDQSGSRVHTNKCLSGRRWSGDYTGDFGYLK